MDAVLQPAPQHRWRLVLLLLLAGVGIAITSYALAETYRFRDEGVLSPRSCSLSEWLDCRATMASRHAYVFGVPINGVGLVYYAWCALTGAIALRLRRVRRGAWRMLFALALVSLGVSLYHGVLLAFEVRVACPTCLVLYAVNLALVLLSASALGLSVGDACRWSWGRLRSTAQRTVRLVQPDGAWVFLVLFGALLAAGGVVAAVREDARWSRLDIQKLEALASFYRKEVVTVDVPDDAPQRGPDEAPVDLVLFSDFQCGFCRRVYGVVAPYQRHVRLRFVHFPLDGDVNPHVRIPGHELSGLAARAAAAAHAAGLFWPLHDYLHGLSTELSHERIVEWFARRGWTEDEANAHIEHPDTTAVVRRDVAVGHRLGVERTPTLYINGRKMGGYNGRMLDLLLRQELKAAGVSVDASLAARRTERRDDG